MKRLKLIFTEWKDNWFSSIITFIILTFAIFFFLVTFGKYRYIKYSYDLVSEIVDVENSVFFSDQTIFMSEDSHRSQYMDLFQQMGEIDALSCIYGSMRRSVFVDGSLNNQIIVCWDELRALFPQRLLKGEWPEEGVNSDGSFNAVVGGDELYGKQVGDVLELKVSNESEPIRVKVSGVLSYPALLPRFNSTSNRMSTDDIFGNGNAIIVNDNEAVRALVEEANISFAPNFIIQFKEDANAEDVAYCKELLSSVGRFQDMSDVMENTEKKIQRTLKEELLFPCFLLFTAFLIYFSISILSVYKKIGNKAIYHLVGCSKRQVVTDVLIHLGIVCILSGLLNVLFALNYGYFFLWGFDLGAVLFDKYVILMVSGVVLLVYAVTAVVCAMIIKRKSPVALLRKFEN